MSLLATVQTPPTAIEKLKSVPPEFWVKVGIAALIVVTVVIILRKLAQTNKIILTIVILVVLSMVGFSWIYERNEPAWATPFVNKIAPFFPSKGAYEVKQTTMPKT